VEDHLGVGGMRLDEWIYPLAELTGGVSVIRQFMQAGLLDEIEISLAHVLLGEGERLVDLDGSAIAFEQIRAVEAPGVTHISYRVNGPADRSNGST
jgi:dihydrofolate reductase